jgi:ubiquitin C-terminal hydrolase
MITNKQEQEYTEEMLQESVNECIEFLDNDDSNDNLSRKELIQAWWDTVSGNKSKVPTDLALEVEEALIRRAVGDQ